MSSNESTSSQSPKKSPPSPQLGPQRGSWMRLVVWFVFTLLVSVWAWEYFSGTTGPADISYTTFRQQVQQGNVERITVQGDRIRGTLVTDALRVTAAGDSAAYSTFVTYLPSFGDEQLLAMLEERGVEVETEPQQNFSWWPLLVSVLPFLLLIGFGLLLFRRMQSQGQSIFSSIKKSGAKLYDRTEQEPTTFDDVAGAAGAKGELEEIVGYLKEPERFQRLGGEVPKGVLLVGPPGTGKTLLARAVAGEADAPFFSITGSDFMEMFVGVGASRVRNLFKEAKKNAPSIIFIDELDSIGRQRGAGLGGGHDEREQTLNQLLSELDGFEPTQSVIVMAATNRPDILDPALLRPGRFDRRITVDMPTQQARKEILEIHARNKPLADEVDLDRIARSTPSFSGADLENLLNEAALIAARTDRDAITNADVEAARDKILMGLERKGLVLSDDERKLVAYHEAGHALVAAVAPHADMLHKVTIIPRGRAMGVTQQLPEREQYIYRREYMRDRLAIMMGGRAAEDLVFDTATSGAANDLKQATHLARKMVLDMGMSDRFRNIAFGGQREQVFLGEEIARGRDYSETTAREIDDEVQRFLNQAYEQATMILRDRRDVLDRLAQELLEHEEIAGTDVLALLDAEPADEPESTEEPDEQPAPAPQGA